MSIILIDKYLVPRYEDAGIVDTINSVAASYYRDDDILTQINLAVEPNLTWESLLRIYSDIEFAGFLGDGVALLGIARQGFEQEPGDLFIPDPIERPERVEGIATDGSFFSTPTEGIYDIVVFQNGELVWTAEGRDISLDRSLDNSGFVTDDIMQVALAAGGVVGWWGRQTIT